MARAARDRRGHVPGSLSGSGEFGMVQKIIDVAGSSPTSFAKAADDAVKTAAGNGPEPEMGPRVRARDGARREESEVVPRHGPDLLRRRALTLTRFGRGLAGRSRTGPTSFPRALRCAERGSPSTPGPTRRPRSSPHGIRTDSNRLSGRARLSESRTFATG